MDIACPEFPPIFSKFKGIFYSLLILWNYSPYNNAEFEIKEPVAKQTYSFAKF